MKHLLNKKHDGFTLLEISIAMVIIGLLLGGITVGSHMIRSAELRKVYTEKERFETAANLFKNKYLAIPGDMSNATRFWGVAGGNGSDATCFSAESNDKKTCNGNGNGILDGYHEGTRMWQHLANAEFIQGQFIGGYNGINHFDGSILAARGYGSDREIYVVFNYYNNILIENSLSIDPTYGGNSESITVVNTNKAQTSRQKKLEQARKAKERKRQINKQRQLNRQKKLEAIQKIKQNREKQRQLTQRGKSGAYLIVESKRKMTNPESIIKNAYWMAGNLGYVSGASEWFDGNYGNILMMGGNVANDMPDGPVLKPEEAWNIDNKVDDGRPATGKIRTMALEYCTDSTNIDAQYDMTISDDGCVMVFPEIF